VSRDGGRDFDFLHGSWRIDHRRLKERLTGCEEWEEFSTRMECRPILGGAGNLDEGEFPSRGYHAMSLRLYDRQEQTWTIYWMTSLSGGIDPGVTGRFNDGVGEFFGPDTHEGTPVLARYTWSDITPAAARWAQAFSTDDGQTWETNWIMRLTRA
jgi:hypothetical protein